MIVYYHVYFDADSHAEFKKILISKITNQKNCAVLEEIGGWGMRSLTASSFRVNLQYIRKNF